MAINDSSDKANQLRETLYQIGRQTVPKYIHEWFFRYFAAGQEIFKAEPKDMLSNYQALFTAASKMLEFKRHQGLYGKFIYDTNPEFQDYTYYFVGDTHGSFNDTYTMIDYFIKAIQVNPKIKIVWIGDYVDRNPYDLQNLSMILAFWIILPENVFILRGNHEDSSVCSRYGFSQHLYDKAGSKPEFTPLWKQITTFFSKLPLGLYCKIGQKKVMVVHGGIPFDVDNYRPLKIAEIEKTLNNEQEEHYDMDKLSQTMLWADPDPFLSEGVAPSPRTGRPRFSEKAFKDFMELNNIDCLIRGHEKWESGYKLFFDNRLISLFSTSTYDSRYIGEAKFLRLRPDTHLSELGDEQMGQGKGILNVDSIFLEEQLFKYYNAKRN